MSRLPVLARGRADTGGMPPELPAAEADSMIAGRVTGQSGVGFQGARVSIPSLNRISLTDSDGHYSIGRLPSWLSDVTASPPEGIDLPAVAATCRVVQGDTTELDFVLHPDLHGGRLGQIARPGGDRLI